MTDQAQFRRGMAAPIGALVLIVLPFLLATMLSGPQAPRAAEPARQGFVGSVTCAACHAAEAAAWRQSDHARAMALPTTANVLGDFSGITVTDSRHTASFRREGEQHIIRTDGTDGVVTDFIITETFGVDPLQQLSLIHI